MTVCPLCDEKDEDDFFRESFSDRFFDWWILPAIIAVAGTLLFAVAGLLAYLGFVAWRAVTALL